MLSSLSFAPVFLNSKSDIELSDPALWLLVREGDEAALEKLYMRHYQVLYRYGLKLAKEKDVAQDCVQEMFFQLWNKREKLKEVQSVRFYLMKWLKREIVRALNNKHSGNNIVPIEGDTDYLGLEVEDIFEKKDIKSHNAMALRKALAELTPREREVIYMRFFLEMTYEEICSAMNLNYQVVMNYVHRALKALRSSNLINKIIGFSLLFISQILYYASSFGNTELLLIA